MPGGDVIRFFVPGDPVPRPEPTIGVNKRTGRPMLFRAPADHPIHAWRLRVALVARRFRPAAPIDGPVRLDLTFYRRPPARVIRSGALTTRWDDREPDRDNLTKPVQDVLQEEGFVVNDSRFCDGDVRKLYAAPGEPAGLEVVVRALGEDDVP